MFNEEDLELLNRFYISGVIPEGKVNEFKKFNETLNFPTIDLAINFNIENIVKCWGNKFAIQMQISAEDACSAFRLAVKNKDITALYIAKPWISKYGADQGDLAVMAAEYGHVEVLDWIVANKFKIDLMASLTAAKYGQLDVIKWLHKNNQKFHPDTITEAINNNSLSVIEYMYIDIGVSINREHVMKLIERGDVEMVKWVFSLDASLTVDDKMLVHAIKFNHMDLVEWLRCRYGMLKIDLIYLAVQEDNIDLLKWCKANGLPITSNVAEHAIFHKKLNILNWYVKERASLSNPGQANHPEVPQAV